jgi:serine/tyrosine/threonine adenylyltransferase
MLAAFDNSYARLPDRFYARLAPTPVSAPRLVKLNRTLALELGLDPQDLTSPEGVAMLAGNRIAPGSEPIALAYAGHQFGNFVPQLGDGRALLLGEVVDVKGVRRDIQLKGSGPTPFSRNGDGRAALGPVLREYIISEAMAALGIPTTRSLAAVLTGDPVYRETALPGAVLTRVASSHIRVGTFQFFAARGDVEGLRLLADHVTARHYPDAGSYRGLFERVIERQAKLVAEWLLVGFIHGVMNTDNMSIAGETIDYGPCAFMDAYHPETVFSSIDRLGRYAYGKQPQIAGWNLARLGEALMPLFDDNEEKALEQANESLKRYGDQFGAAYLGGLRRKFGLFTERDDDGELVQGFLKLLMDNGLDYTLSFRRLSNGEMPVEDDGWTARYRARLALEPQHEATRRAAMQAVNPLYIPRNHRVEAALNAAIENDDYGPFEELLVVLARPFEERPEFAAYAQPPSEEDRRNFRTYCGT